MQWRNERRYQSLRVFAERSKQLKWAPSLLAFLLEELWTERELSLFVEGLNRLPRSRYPQAVAVALALRHSWRQDHLQLAAKRLGLQTDGL